MRSSSCTKARAFARSFTSRGREAEPLLAKRSRRLRVLPLRAAFAALAAVFAVAGRAQAPAGDALSPIDCSRPTEAAVCMVDTPTYVGWRVYHAQCATCHAQDALGSSFAPDLTARVRTMDERAFFRALDDEDLVAHDPAAPPRAVTADAGRYYRELWVYLSARASGALPAGPLVRRPPTGSYGRPRVEL